MEVNMNSARLSFALNYANKGWYVFPIKEKTTNKPRVKWGTKATLDRKIITEWWTNWPKDNIGIATGPSNLCIIDIDIKSGKQGQETLDNLELDHGQLPDTLSAKTPSGGLHFYFRGNARTTVEKLGPGIDTRGSGGAGGYVLAPGSETSIGKYEWLEGSQVAVADLPQWIHQFTGQRADRQHNQEPVVDQDAPHYINWAIEHLKQDARIAIAGKQGNSTTFYLACVLREKGLSCEKTQELMAKHWNDRCDPPWSTEELFEIVENAFNYASVVPPGGDTPEYDFGSPSDDNDTGQYAPPPVSGEQEKRYTGVMNDWVWIAQAKMFYRRRDGMMFDTKSFDSMFNYMIEGKGSISTEIFSSKLSMRKFDKMDFLPERPEFITEINAETVRIYNIWRPSKLKPKSGNADVFLNHMSYMFEDEYERNLVLNYMAWCVQNPAQKPNFAMVIKGKEGTGKSFMGQILERIFGPHNTGRPMNASIQSQFNGWARNVKLVIIEELMARGRVDIMNHLKPMITDPIIEINEKYQPAQKITNNCVIMAFTNHDDALPLKDDDRRYMIIISDPFPKGANYYRDLFKWAESGGDSIVWDWLLKRDIGKFNGKGRAPASKSKDDMREASRTDHDARWLHLFISDLPPFHGQYVSEQDLVDALPESLRIKNARGHARKFLNNSIPAYNTRIQTRTKSGRLILWALSEKYTTGFSSREILAQLRKREEHRSMKMRAVIYNREMTLEAMQQAEEVILGSPWDDLSNISVTDSNDRDNRDNDRDSDRNRNDKHRNKSKSQTKAVVQLSSYRSGNQGVNTDNDPLI